MAILYEDTLTAERVSDGEPHTYGAQSPGAWYVRLRTGSGSSGRVVEMALDGSFLVGGVSVNNLDNPFKKNTQYKVTIEEV